MAGREIPEEVAKEMNSILDHSGIEGWWETQIPALGWRTPAKVWEEDPDQVRQLMDAYRSSSYM